MQTIRKRPIGFESPSTVSNPKKFKKAFLKTFEFSQDSLASPASDNDELSFSSDSPLPLDLHIREAKSEDLKIISDLLTEAFFGKFNLLNPIKTPLEWLKTYLSLEDSLTQAQKSELFFMFVVCEKRNSNEVIGYCEVDCRPTSNPKAAPRPYMCNLVVKDEWRGRNIGESLILNCEERVKNWWKQETLYLRVRKKNIIALGLYKKLGYTEADMKDDQGFLEDGVLLLKKKMC